jgi:16S rRNA processing protein RimM
MRIEATRAHGNRLLVSFAGCHSREEAQKLRGALFVSTEEARALQPDEFWPHELMGCELCLRDGTNVGTVLAVLPGAAQDLLSVATARGDRLIPMARQIVVDVDVDRRLIIVDPPEGLLD